jgi:lysozyme family protein
MRDLPRATAVHIYYQQYAVKPGFAAVAEISEAIAEELFDTGVNMGPTIPARWLQEWLNAMNQRGKLYADITADGKIGPATLNALRAYLRTRGAEAETVMVRALNCSQGERYRSLATNRPANEDFIYGWLRTRVA